MTSNIPGEVFEPPATVVDSVTDLEWQQSDDDSVKTWQEALSYCETLELDAKSDWRLPDIRELVSLVDPARYSPAINPDQNLIPMYNEF